MNLDHDDGYNDAVQLGNVLGDLSKANRRAEAAEAECRKLRARIAELEGAALEKRGRQVHRVPARMSDMRGGMGGCNADMAEDDRRDREATLKAENEKLAMDLVSTEHKRVVLRDALSAALQIAQIGWEAEEDREEARSAYERLMSGLRRVLRDAYLNET